MEFSDYNVYMHTSPDGKVYIGITRQNPPRKRWQSNTAYYCNKRFSEAIKKFGGIRNFKHEVLYCGLTKERAKEIEIDLIAKYRSTDPEYGYNVKNGGEHYVDGLSQEERDKRKRDYDARYRAEHIDWVRAYNRKYGSTREYKDHKNEYNKTPARRKHRAEYMRMYNARKRAMKEVV